MAKKKPDSRRSKPFIQLLGLGIGVLMIISLPLLPVLLPLLSGSSPQPSNIENRQQVVDRYVRENGLAALIGDSPRIGAEGAEVFLIEFSDFQCPFCARAYPTVKEFMATHGDSVQLVYKHLPIVQIHPQALPAARASWAAEQQGKFWEYHDRLFENQAELGEPLYVQTAEDLGLDMEQFDRDRNSRESRQAIERDLEIANALGIRSTPTFVMNNLLIPGAAPLNLFEQALASLQAE
ncbi:thioredoxin domain-containing protein [Synechococcus sp. PCC 7336]|uniref:DsbA family protein n=1 Tax=Synechococcus sp. PCC 7336 TaxID=195250 RepID=UPI00034723A6|nr:thioredoxin domain-containing protein [Synechococcus sp. PCC 7336]